MSAEQQLAVVPPQETALAVYSAEKGLEPWLQVIRSKIDGFTPDISSRKGREAIASMAYAVARSKTALDDVGKKLVADLKEVPKKIDAERKRVRDTLDSWQEEVRRPLNEWQAAEDARVDKHNSGIETIKAYLVLADQEPAAMIAELIAQLESVAIDQSWEEFEAEAARAKDSTLTGLRSALGKQEKVEAEQAELARLRAEAEVRAKADYEAEIAREAAEKAQREAEEKAQAERDAAAKREQALIDQAAQAQRDADQKIRDAEAAAANQALQLQLAAEQAERQKIQAEADRVEAIRREEQQAVEAERRQAEAVEQARLAEVARANAAADEINRQAAAREADKAHKGAIYKAAKEAFIANGMSEECARLAVKVIASGFIPAISITY
ncbi:hypothetical protein EQV97_22875 [Pseudomonas sp. TMW22090]|uniref:hypothetical protein n=1 Tax=Pseudomonas sp. TMW22090 TaxID=2506434 RepID=UPI001F10F247|nr:hypothetical protein [Pseudomonas sp. TMW22090]MCH4880204.1 hypothetical protein [Pseudomonas sp. TMW22090]